MVGRSRWIKIYCIVMGLLSLLISVVPLYSQSSQSSDGFVRLTNHYAKERRSPCTGCTQIYFSPSEEILVSRELDVLLYRSRGEENFVAAPISLSGPHSIAFNSADGLYYLNDTDNNRILALDSLDMGMITREIHELAGKKLTRPHDVAIDPTSGWIYTINPHQPIVFRFGRRGEKEGFLDLSKVLDYSRALSIINGTVYVAGTSHGKIVEITDFDRGKYKVYQSAGKKKKRSSGNWETCGLIINDIDYFQGYWYASSYFHPSASTHNQDHNSNKFIRFKSWQDFESGNWQDLSSLLPDGLVPYYLTVQKDGLYIALLNHEFPGNGDTIYKLSTMSQSLPIVVNLLLH